MSANRNQSLHRPPKGNVEYVNTSLQWFALANKWECQSGPFHLPLCSLGWAVVW